MDIKKLQRVIIDALEDVKAQDIRVFNTTGQTDLFDRVIIATGTSNRQTRALASHVRDKAKQAGGMQFVTVNVGRCVSGHGLHQSGDKMGMCADASMPVGRFIRTISGGFGRRCGHGALL
jgi:hypothetical protein